ACRRLRRRRHQQRGRQPVPAQGPGLRRGLSGAAPRRPAGHGRSRPRARPAARDSDPSSRLGRLSVGCAVRDRDVQGPQAGGLQGDCARGDWLVRHRRLRALPAVQRRAAGAAPDARSARSPRPDRDQHVRWRSQAGRWRCPPRSRASIVATGREYGDRVLTSSPADPSASEDDPMSQAQPIAIDLDGLRAAIRAEYAAVASEPERGFHFHTGQRLATILGYPQDWIESLPVGAVLSMAGTGNPLALGEVQPGERVVDCGSGAGADALIAARLVGPTGRVIGVDMTPEMVARAQANAREAGLANVEFREGLLEALPVDDGWADLLISNGVLNLVPNKGAALGE